MGTVRSRNSLVYSRTLAEFMKPSGFIKAWKTTMMKHKISVGTQERWYNQMVAVVAELDFEG